MISGWRIVKRKFAASAFSGIGASLSGGRWNSPGTKVVYTAATTSLAMLESLVHMNSDSLLSQYTLLEARIPESLIDSIDRDTLPSDWQEKPFSSAARAFGDKWLESNVNAVLAVPSCIVMHEINYLLNPNHPDFSQILLRDKGSLEVDERLLKKSS